MDNPGQLLSFVDPELIPDDPNVNNSGLTVNQYGYQSITGYYGFKSFGVCSSTRMD